MPRFYFDVWEEGCATRDDTGLELESLEAAEYEATRAAAGIGQDSLPKGRPEIIVQVRDEHGQPVLTVAVSMTVCRIDLARA